MPVDLSACEDVEFRDGTVWRLVDGVWIGDPVPSTTRSLGLCPRLRYARAQRIRNRAAFVLLGWSWLVFASSPLWR